MINCNVLEVPGELPNKKMTNAFSDYIPSIAFAINKIKNSLFCSKDTVACIAKSRADISFVI